jgi:hypothetical protein
MANKLHFGRHGAQGNLDTASKSTLENEFGSVSEDEVIKQILEKGELQESKVSDLFLGVQDAPSATREADIGLSLQMPERQGPKNDAQGTLGGH